MKHIQSKHSSPNITMHVKQNYNQLNEGWKILGMGSKKDPQISISALLNCPELLPNKLAISMRRQNLINEGHQQPKNRFTSMESPESPRCCIETTEWECLYSGYSWYSCRSCSIHELPETEPRGTKYRLVRLWSPKGPWSRVLDWTQITDLRKQRGRATEATRRERGREGVSFVSEEKKKKTDNKITKIVIIN